MRRREGEEREGKDLGKLVSSIASKPIHFCWIRTGSEKLCAGSYYRQFSKNIRIKVIMGEGRQIDQFLKSKVKRA